MGFFQAAVGKGGVVYFGNTHYMIPFLEAQDCFTRVIHTPHQNTDDFKSTMRGLWTPRDLRGKPHARHSGHWHRTLSFRAHRG